MPHTSSTAPASAAHALDRLIGATLPRFETPADVAGFEAQAPWAERVAAASTYEALRIGAALNPQAPALKFLPNASPDDVPLVWTHAEFFGRVTQAANLFHRLGVGAGDVVSLLLPLLPQAFVALYGAQAVGMEKETNIRLSRVGFDKMIGYLDGGFDAWSKTGKEIDAINRISAEEFAKQVSIGESKIIDIRKETEYSAEHVAEAYNKPLASINDWIKDIDPKEHFFLHCAGGYRSMIAASILESRGFRNFSEIEGGFNAIAKTSIPTTDFVCQSKILV